MNPKDDKVILTIEDDESIRESFVSFLEDYFYPVLGAVDGKQGLKIFREHKPDLILLDLRMPEMNGFEVLKKITAESPDTPIIVVSGVGVVEDAIRAVKLGAWDYILKPVEDMEVMLMAIRKVFEKVELIKKNRNYQNKLEEIIEERTRDLKISESNLASVVRAVPDVIYRLNNQGIITFISNSITNYGYIIEELIGRHIFTIIHPDDQIKAKNQINERRTGNRRTKNLEIRIIAKNQDIIPFEVQSGDIKYDPVLLVQAEGIYEADEENKFLGTQGIARDITERKITERKLKASLAEKEVLLKEIHHRVKNNMQIISSLLNLHMRNIVNDEIQDILKESQNRIISMLIVHESIYNTENFTQIEVATYIKKVAEQLLISYDTRGDVKIKFDLEDIQVSMDSCIPIGLIVTELITNSLKYAFPNSGKGEIKITLLSITENKAKLIVRDNGSGVPPEVDKETSSMGLSLVHTLVRQVNGNIKIDKNGGYTYTIIFDSQINQSSMK